MKYSFNEILQVKNNKVTRIFSVEDRLEIIDHNPHTNIYQLRDESGFTDRVAEENLQKFDNDYPDQYYDRVQ